MEMGPVGLTGDRARQKRGALIAVQQELTSQDEQPDPEREPQWSARDAGAEHGAAEGSDGSPRDQLKKKRRVRVAGKPVCSATDERDDKAEGNVSADDLSGNERSKAQERSAAKRTG